MSQAIVIPGRFNGPPGSGNGGYVCGVVAGLVDGVAEVTLRTPPPLDRPLDVVLGDAGSVTILDGDTLIARARQIAFDPPEPPRAPTWEEAEAASHGYRGHLNHDFATCFTCGPDRNDGLGIFPGPTAAGLAAAPWTPDGSLPNHKGIVTTPIVWAALDCPGAWVDARDMTEDPVVLGRMAAVASEPVEINRRYVAIAWTLGKDGRKSYAATALIDESGNTVATARQTWISLA